LCADEGKFKQILYNLLSNAIKFTPDGGQVTLTASLGTPGECLRIAVADTGIGIKPEDHERVFREFEQVDSSYGRQQQGTGLGLALTKRLVEMHGGEIRVESEGIEGKGSVFTFVIPIHKPTTRAVQAPESAAPKTEVLRPRVLVFATNDSNLQFLTDYLTGAGYQVQSVAGAEELQTSFDETVPFAVAAHSENFASEEELSACRSRIPPRVPLVIFWFNEHEMPEFRVFSAKGPIRKSAARLMDAVRGVRRSSGKELKTVLIIDDEPAIVELLGVTLMKKGFCVLSATNGQAGVNLARTHVPDLVILDIAMPDFDGKQVVQELRSQAATKDIPVLIHTATSLGEEERHDLAAQVQSITFKNEQEMLFAELERLENLANQKLEMEETL
jgi:CheY-like chemotaxis protein/anti-sigma regulatory factor (Ser/Thr protein kinase)